MKRKKSQTQSIYGILKDGKWHSSLEFNKPSVAGWHGAQRIHDMRKRARGTKYSIVGELARHVFTNWKGNPQIMAYKLIKQK